MEFTPQEQESIIALIKKGDRFDKVAKAIGGHCTWQDVQAFCWQTKQWSWQGSKKVISTRLQSLRSATKREDRENLAAEIDERVSYLYNCAKEMKARIDEIEKFLAKYKTM
jgi:hypothetical protein